MLCVNLVADAEMVHQDEFFKFMTSNDELGMVLMEATVWGQRHQQWIICQYSTEKDPFFAANGTLQQTYIPAMRQAKPDIAPAKLAALYQYGLQIGREAIKDNFTAEQCNELTAKDVADYKASFLEAD